MFSGLWHYLLDRQLVSRFRSSQILAAPSDANFGIKGTQTNARPAAEAWSRRGDDARTVNGPRAVAVGAMPALACSRGYAQPASSATPALPDRELIVATREVPPFAMKNKDGSWRGISIELWRRVAERLH